MRFLALLALLALALAPASGAAFEVGAGVAGGESFPLAQTDNASGGQFALRVPVNVIPLLTVEPFMNVTSLGNGEVEVAGRPYDREGFHIFSYGVIAALGPMGMGPRYRVYPFLGMGAYHPSRAGSPSKTRPGYMIGAGYAHRLPAHVAIHARSDFNWITMDGASRRFFEISLGVSIRLHPAEDVKEDF